MAKDMLGTAVRKLVTLPAATLGIVCDLLEKMTDDKWVVAVKKFLRKEEPWANVQQTTPSVLEEVGTVATPAIPTFRAKEHFKDDRSGPVVIGYFGDNFSRVFLSGDGMVEGAAAEATFRIHKLRKNSVDTPIIAELGEMVAETTLGQVYEMMKVQGRGEQGNLLTNGYANIFYIRDRDNVLWAVHCYWNSDGRCWDVLTSPVSPPYPWCAGRQVVSR